MDFSLSEDQAMLRDSVARYLEKTYDQRGRETVLHASGFSAAHWSAFAELGWLAAPFPEEVGGLGGGPAATMVIMEAFGRRLVLEPFVSSVVVGGQLLMADPDAARRGARIGAVIEGRSRLALAAGEGDRGYDFASIAGAATRDGAGYRLRLRKPVVADGAAADRFVVAARTAGSAGDPRGLTLFLVDRDHPGVSVETFRRHDGATAAALTLDGVALGADAVLGEADEGLAVLERARDHGVAALCAEAVGSAEYLVGATADYLKLRVQYDQPIARFQVVQHRLADMYMASELARSMSYAAALALDASDAQRARDVSAAKASVNRHARFVAAQAVQLHGGMGMSEELDVAHHFKRMIAIGRTFGDEAFHLRRFVALDAGLAAA